MAKILVVDDSSVYRKQLVTLLSSDGHLTLEANDGLDGLIVARAERPDIVISDIVMPSLDGFGMVRALREDAQLAETRVIFCTANFNEEETKNLARACQVPFVLMKPCDSAEVLRAVEQVLAGVRESGPPASTEFFDHDHVFLLTNKLTETSTALALATARFSALADLNFRLAAAEDVQVLLETLCTGARNLLGSRYAVAALTEGKSTLVTRYAASGIEFSHRPPPPVVTSGPIHQVMLSGNPWRAHAVRGDLRAGLPAGYPPAGSYLAVSLGLEEQTLGWLCVADKLGGGAFDELDERLLRGLAAVATRLYTNVAYEEDAALLRSNRSG